jgi:hypothetical protein
MHLRKCLKNAERDVSGSAVGKIWAVECVVQWGEGGKVVLVRWGGPPGVANPCLALGTRKVAKRMGLGLARGATWG